MEQSLQLINDILDRLFAYGPFWIYFALFVSSFVENIFPPIPGDFITLTGGALAGAGRINIFLVFLLVCLGGIASMIFIYYLGYSRGREYFLRKNFKIFSSKDIYRLDDWFKRRGIVVLLFNRFIVGVRAVMGLVSGISRYNPIRFVFFISISFMIFNGLLLFSSYIFVVNFETVAHYLKLYERIVWPIIIAIVLALIIIKFRRVRLNEK